METHKAVNLAGESVAMGYIETHLGEVPPSGWVTGA